MGTRLEVTIALLLTIPSGDNTDKADSVAEDPPQRLTMVGLEYVPLKYPESLRDPWQAHHTSNVEVTTPAKQP
jgi:hypothetical protein